MLFDGINILNMIFFKHPITYFLIAGSLLIMSCEPEGGRRGSPNAPEIVSRTDDTTFNQVPGEAHHGIDTYAEAGESGNLFRTMSEAGSFTKFSEAVTRAGMRETLIGDEPYTVFAPTDQAFSQISQEKINELYKPENKQKLIDLVNNHIVKGNIDQDDLSDGSTLTTLTGETINVKMVDGRPTINNNPIVEQGENPENGALYALDEVILPPGI